MSNNISNQKQNQSWSLKSSQLYTHSVVCLLTVCHHSKLLYAKEEQRGRLFETYIVGTIIPVESEQAFCSN